VLPMLINVIWSWSRGPKASGNPWNALTLEWTTPSPPPVENWAVLPVVTHGPYEYGVGIQPPQPDQPALDEA